MLKKRIIPVLLLKNGRMVKGKNFQNFIDTGNPNTAVKIYTSQYADELMFIDITANSETRKTLIEIISNAAKDALMPFTVGGGIKSEEDVRQILANGADKVLITTEALYNNSLITESAKKFGSQAIITGIDYKFDQEKKNFFVWTHSGKKKTNLSPLELAKVYQDLGAGEVMINNIDRDGLMRGYDLEISQQISSILKVPLITCGGAGNFQHIVNLFSETEVSAAACSSIFHFGDNCPMQARTYLRNHGIEMRNIK